MNLLAFETSSNTMSVALKKGQNPTQEIAIEGLREHSEQLLPRMNELLRAAATNLEEIDAFLVGRGPGSFTGLRVGFATLKGFLAARPKPCYGMLSLDLVAHGITGTPGQNLAVCFDARRQLMNYCIYEFLDDGWKATCEPGISPFETVLEKFPAETSVAGDAVVAYQEKFKAAAHSKKLNFVDENLWFPRAATLISCYTKFSGAAPLVALEKLTDLIPLYFRLSEPEERLKHASDP